MSNLSPSDFQKLTDRLRGSDGQIDLNDPQTRQALDDAFRTGTLPPIPPGGFNPSPPPRGPKPTPPKSGCFGQFATAALLTGVWALCTGREKKQSEITPVLPEKIPVVATTLPCKTVTGNEDDKTLPVGQKYIEPAGLDLSGSFEIDTGRYRIIKSDDVKVAQWAGHIFSLPGKIFFWDLRVGGGIDDHGARTVLSLLERDSTIQGVTVRLNHSAPIEDVQRIFSDPRAIERNPWIYRAVPGVPGTFISEIQSAIRRADHYNPVTNTVVLYSDIPVIASHELGHVKDYTRFSTSWWYSLAKAFPPVLLYQEARANLLGREILPEDQRWQSIRYSIPAFATYVIGTFVAAGRFLRKVAERRGYSADQIQPRHVVRHYLAANATFLSALYAGGSAAASGASSIASIAAGVGAFIVAGIVTGAIGRSRASLRYPFEK